MMDKRPKKDLIENIRHSLRNFEETYHPEEWEHFQRHRKNKPRKPIPLFVKLAGIAASLIVVVYASVSLLPLLDTNKDVVKPQNEAPEPAKPSTPAPPDTLQVDPTEMTTVQEDFQPIAIPATGPATPHLAMGKTAITQADAVPGVEAILTADFQHLHPMQPALSLPGQATGYKRSAVHASTREKWRFNFPRIRPFAGDWEGFDGTDIGFNIAPGLTGMGFAWGGGVSANIPLSGRLSTEVGLSYMNLRVGTNLKADITDTVTLQTVKIRNSVGMVAFPVSLNYSFTENMGASLGITPVRVVKDHRTDILQSYRWVAGDTTGRLVSERTRARRTDTAYIGQMYFGFIQVAGRYSPPFVKKRNLVVSPFVAIPVGRLRNDEYRWLHGGVSFRFYLP